MSEREAAAAELPRASLEAYLRRAMPLWQGLARSDRLSGGQSNPTYLITDTAGGRFVLRKKPSGVLLPSAHAIEREYRVMRALETSVPVPQMHLLCEDPAIIGTPFYVMEYVSGRLYMDPALPSFEASARGELYQDIVKVIAKLHTLDYRSLGLTGYGKEGGFVTRQIIRFTQQYRASELEKIDEMDRLIEWLPTHIPAVDETAIFHGDLRLDNFVLHPTEPRIIAILDWELSTLGHPLADLSYHMLPWRLSADEFRGMAGIDYGAHRLPTEQQYLKDYCRLTQRAMLSDSTWTFFMAFSMFRLAAILAGILRRARDGNAAGADAEQTGQRARAIAKAAWRQI